MRVFYWTIIETKTYFGGSRKIVVRIEELKNMISNGVQFRSEIVHDEVRNENEYGMQTQKC
jgi:hypothetical protein